MKRFETSRSSLFLMELILAILFFSIASAICIQLFVKASMINSNSIEKSKAAIQAQSVAEIFQATQYSMEEVHTILPESYIKESQLYVYYDKDWQICSQLEATYTLLVKQEEQSIQMTISDEELIYSLMVKYYHPMKA